ncbi:response regulator receiver sensor signal transduction histidine kinase [Richelia sinica FACHB-800]|uniref:histidine kinase n=1 Tax=Richelia sinica FACHB-800 TaxID=1357546 RepID=A0A975T6P5_9NOST|nr:response regulator [Richelia sinica]MBD2664331.1 hybrid sensor histidine kinase/response regulator [Richelia sinica FACHB-800]QXE22433.1 response regulator receiver sensor signal transduction histidine kinase [Richelia sinica FACHB-800]
MLSHQDHQKGNILVVDDTPDNLRLLSAVLTAQGYDVRKALSGKMALTACQTKIPDLILLDINMPDMDGYQVCQELKSDHTTSHIPVIFISALDDVLDKTKAFQLGGVDYITKPFHSTEVILRVENQLNVRNLQLKLQEKNLLLSQALVDLEAAQVERIQKEKMISLGRLVAGIAHEVNNPISFIYGNLQYASQYVQDLVDLIEVYQQEYPQPTAKIQSIFEDIDLYFVFNDLQNLMSAMHRGANRIREIVHALQNFARLDEAEMKEVDIHQGIESTLLMLEHRLRKTESRPEITIIKDYSQLPLVECYAGELNQVLIHLLSNAIDVFEVPEIDASLSKLGEKNNSQRHYLEVNLLSKPIEHPEIRITTQLTTAQTVKIAIADNGPGIPEAVRSRLFDPFFTTKPVGKGTGLGLSISYQIIVHKHHGKLTCNSSPGAGAEFVMEIPIQQPQME